MTRYPVPPGVGVAMSRPGAPYTPDGTLSKESFAMAITPGSAAEKPAPYAWGQAAADGSRGAAAGSPDGAWKACRGWDQATWASFDTSSIAAATGSLGGTRMT